MPETYTSSDYMTRFSSGSLVGLKKPLGDEWSHTRLDTVLVLDQPERPAQLSRPEIIVAMVSYAVEMASDLDVRFEFNGVRAMVEVWNQRTILLEDLKDQPEEQLGPVFLSTVYGVHNRMFGIEDETPVSGLVGSEIVVETDPRLDYQRQRVVLAEALSDRLHQAMSWAEPDISFEGSYALDLLDISHQWRVVVLGVDGKVNHSRRPTFTAFYHLTDPTNSLPADFPVACRSSEQAVAA